MRTSVACAAFKQETPTSEPTAFVVFPRANLKLEGSLNALTVDAEDVPVNYDGTVTVQSDSISAFGLCF